MSNDDWTITLDKPTGEGRFTLHVVDHPDGGKALVVMGKLPEGDNTFPDDRMWVLHQTLCRVLVEELDKSWRE